MPLKILIPVDFSPASEKAGSIAELIRQQQETELFLLHVISPNGHVEDQHDAVEFFSADVLTAREKFKALRSNLNFSYEIRAGRVTDTIKEYAEDIRADLIIMGTKGASGLTELISGSEAQHVARHSSVPVITVHEQSAPAKLENILLLSDFESDGFHPALELLKELTAGKARFHLLHILKQHELARIAEIEDHMEKFALQNQIQNFNLHIRQEDKVDEGVYQFTSEHEMDLVCIGTHARKGLGHLLFGSIAEKLINHCPKPVFTYHLK